MVNDKKIQKSYFDVLGICCSSEVAMIENILKPLEGVEKVTVIVPTRTVIVVHDSLQLSQLEIVKALNQAKLEANIRAYGASNYKNKWPSPYAVASGVLLALSFLKYAFRPLQYLALGAVAVGIWPIICKSFVAVKSFRLDINVLMLIAVAGTIALRDYTESGAIVFLFILADWLEARASHKASVMMSKLMDLSPRKAVLAETGEEVEVDDVKFNTLLAVKAGEVIPIDGIVVDGNCEVDEKTLTGESFPVAKEKDSTVWAGTINLNGYICLKTTALAEDCVVAKMAKLVEEAQNSKSSTERFVDKCAKYYTPAVIVISTSVAVIPVALRVHNTKHWLHLALVVLVSACPCALILSTPVATFCALTNAAAAGLLVKGADYLETFSKVKIAAFDKTGTITRGEFVVVDFQCLSEDITLNRLLFWVSSIESKSSHPMASALVEHAKLLSVEPKSELVEDFQNFPGEGIYGKIDGNAIYIGNKRIAERARGTIQEIIAEEGKTTGYVYCGATLVGTFSLSDACRTGVAEAINELKSMGVKTAMLTGDNNAAAMHVHEQLGRSLDIVHAELLPEDKARLIQEFKQEGKTAMIGDGLNDAPALATADIGISMGISGSALATETGHIILMSNDIRKIPKALKLARRTHRKVIINVILSIITKAAVLVFAFAVQPLVWLAVVADVGTCLLVIFNSMLLLPGSQTNRSKRNTVHCSSPCSQKQGCSDPKVEKKCSAQKSTSKACASRSKTAPCADTCVEPCGNEKNGGSQEGTWCDRGESCDALKTDETELHDLIDSCCPEPCNSTNECCSEPCNAASDSVSGSNHVSLCMEDKCKDSVEQQLDGGKASEILQRAEHEHHHVFKCCSGNLEPLHSDINVPVATNRALVRTCGSLRKREVRCCRRSVRSCCCAKYLNVGHGFGGSSTEIVIG